MLLSSGVSKKLRLNSEPASKTTSGVILSGDGALPRLPLRDWSILKTSMMQAEDEEEQSVYIHSCEVADVSVIVKRNYRCRLSL